MRISILPIVLCGCLLIHLFLIQNHTLRSDEGTHAILAMFYKDLIINLRSFNSFNDVLEFATEYAIKYPKITPIYPPLYHLLLTTLFLVKESVFVGRVLNLSITILTAFVIYKLGLKLLDSEKCAILSSIFFLNFTTIFTHTTRLMMDIPQALVFSLVLLYYLELKKKRRIGWREVLILSILLTIAFLTKFFSVFLVPTILLDSFFSRRKIFKHCLLSIALSGIIISPYSFLFLKFRLYKFFLKVATSAFHSRWIYFDFPRNFGFFIGWFVAPSTILFLWKNRKNVLLMSWFFLPLLTFMFFRDCDIRFAYILMPIYAISCGFTMKKIYSLRSKQRRNIIIGLIFGLMILQLFHNIYLSYESFRYPIDEFMGMAEKKGNILILSEEPVYSSVYIFYGRLNNIQGNIIRPCLLLKSNLTDNLLEEWGIRYIIDQNQSIDEIAKDSLNLTLAGELKTEDYDLRLFETPIEKEVECNYICRLEGKVCKEDGFSGFLKLISK